MAKTKSWLFQDVPVYSEGEGKKRRWYVQLNDGMEIEVRPVSGYALWLLHRSYIGQAPEPPVVEMQLEGVDAVQRTRDTNDPGYREQITRIFLELDAQMTVELLQGVVLPSDDDWLSDWRAKGRPEPSDPTMKVDLYLLHRGVDDFDARSMLIRAIDAISQETPAAIERAQEFFRVYMGRNETAASSAAGDQPSDNHEGRGSRRDEGVPDEREAMVQTPAGGAPDTPGLPAQREDEGVSQQPRRKGSKRSQVA